MKSPTRVDFDPSISGLSWLLEYRRISKLIDRRNRVLGDEG
jgi:hypothetical protein